MGFSPCPSVLSSRKVQVLTPSWWTPTYLRVVVAVDLPGLVFHTGPWAVGDDVADVVEPHDAGDGAAAVPESGLAEDDDGMRELEVTQVGPARRHGIQC